MSASKKNQINFIKKIEQIFKCKKNGKNLSFKLNLKVKLLILLKDLKILKLNQEFFFSAQENYTSNFGFQWNEFKKHN